MDLEFIKRTVFENEDVVKDALNRYSKSEIFFAEGRTCVSIELDLNGDSFDRNLPSINQELGRLQVGNQDKLIYSIWVDERLPLQTEAVCIEQGLTNLAQNFPNLYSLKVMNYFRFNKNFSLLSGSRISSDFSRISLLAGRKKSPVEMSSEDYEDAIMAIGIAAFHSSEEYRKRAKQYINTIFDIRLGVLDLESKLMVFNDDFQF